MKNDNVNQTQKLSGGIIALLIILACVFITGVIFLFWNYWYQKPQDPNDKFEELANKIIESGITKIELYEFLRIMVFEGSNEEIDTILEDLGIIENPIYFKEDIDRVWRFLLEGMGQDHKQQFSQKWESIMNSDLKSEDKQSKNDTSTQQRVSPDDIENSKNISGNMDQKNGNIVK